MNETKKCPYCREEILADAIKCKHCGEMLIKPVYEEYGMFLSNPLVQVLNYICIFISLIIGLIIGVSFENMYAITILIILGVYLTLGISLYVYMLPAILACSKRHEQFVLLCVLNIIFGATLIGWLGCLIWATQKKEIVIIER